MNLRLFLLLFAFALPAYAGVEQLSEQEFQKLAEDLAPKVNLFRDTWEKDPGAEFYGGTTRDYLYWIKGNFKDAKTHDEALAIAQKLRAEPVIDVRSFIIGESDVDVFTKGTYTIRPDEYGVRKIDLQSPEMLDPTTELGRNERNQGFIPAEKIRLGKEGFAKPGELGDGLKEIYRGKLTVHFATPEQFKTTKYAQEGLNHPILLALRYLRLQAIDYFHSHGAGLPNKHELLSAIDPASDKAVREVIAGTLDGETLRPYLQKEKFKSWINGAIQKAFRSYTNPTAAKELTHEFQVDRLPELYPQIETTNQYVFQKYRDEKAIARERVNYHVDEKAFYRPVAEEFPDGKLYHGTRNQAAFRGILLQGVLGSEGGSAGKGLYGVRETSRKFAEEWGGTKDRLLTFPVKPSARIVDIRSGEGKRVWDAYVAKHGGDFEGFSEAFGVDLLRYPYGDTEAYVVKNSAALEKAGGVFQQILPLPELLKRAEQIRDPKELYALAAINGLSARETSQMAARIPITDEEALAALKTGRDRQHYIRLFLSRPDFPERNAVIKDLLDHGSREELLAVVEHAFGKSNGEIPAELWRDLGRKPKLNQLTRQYVLDRYWNTPLGAPVLPEHQTLLRELLANGSLDSELSQVFRCAGLGDQRELLEGWIARQEQRAAGEAFAAGLGNVATGIQFDFYKKDPELLKRFLKLPRAPQEFLNNLKMKAATPDWLIEELGQYPDAHRDLVQTFFTQAHVRAAHPELFERITQEGRADDVLAGFLLPEFYAHDEDHPQFFRLADLILSRPEPDDRALNYLAKFVKAEPRLAPPLREAFTRAMTHLKGPEAVIKAQQIATAYEVPVDFPTFEAKLLQELENEVRSGVKYYQRLYPELYSGMNSLAGHWIYDQPAGSPGRRALVAWMALQEAGEWPYLARDILAAGPDIVGGDPPLAAAARRWIGEFLTNDKNSLPVFGSISGELVDLVSADPELLAWPGMEEGLLRYRARLVERKDHEAIAHLDPVLEKVLALKKTPPAAICAQKFGEL